MPTYVCEAVVLKTYEVGEADCFCVVLTDRLGRLALRVHGVRRPLHRYVGLLQSFQRLTLELAERRGTWRLLRAEVLRAPGRLSHDVVAFVVVSRGVDLLLRLLPDDLPLSDVYTLFSGFLEACRASPHTSLFPEFAFSLLFLLGECPAPQVHTETGEAMGVGREVVFVPGRGFLPLGHRSQRPGHRRISAALHEAMCRLPGQAFGGLCHLSRSDLAALEGLVSDVVAWSGIGGVSSGGRVFPVPATPICL